MVAIERDNPAPRADAHPRGSTFAYGDRPDFFDDRFLMSDVDSAQVMTLSDPSGRRG